MNARSCVTVVAASTKRLCASPAENDAREAETVLRSDLPRRERALSLSDYFAAGFAGSLAAASLASGFASLAFASLAALGSLAGMKSNLPFW